MHWRFGIDKDKWKAMINNEKELIQLVKSVDHRCVMNVLDSSGKKAKHMNPDGEKPVDMRFVEVIIDDTKKVFEVRPIFNLTRMFGDK